jgi:hypothetical protein
MTSCLQRKINRLCEREWPPQASKISCNAKCKGNDGKGGNQGRGSSSSRKRVIEKRETEKRNDLEMRPRPSGGGGRRCEAVETTSKWIDVELVVVCFCCQQQENHNYYRHDSSLQ